MGAATLTALGTRSVTITMWKEMLSESPAVEKVLQELLRVLTNHSLYHMSTSTGDRPRVLALAVSSSLIQLSLSPCSPSLSTPKPGSCPGHGDAPLDLPGALGVSLPIFHSIPTPLEVGWKPGGQGKDGVCVLSAGSKDPA